MALHAAAADSGTGDTGLVPRMQRGYVLVICVQGQLQPRATPSVLLHQKIPCIGRDYQRLHEA